MKVTKACPHCDRVFKSSNRDGMALGRLAANLANHIKGTHPEKYIPSKWILAKQARDKKNQGAALKPQILISGPDPEPVKRPYTRKPAPPLSVCFCPKCGCNIRAVQVAMGL